MPELANAVMSCRHCDTDVEHRDKHRFGEAANQTIFTTLREEITVADNLYEKENRDEPPLENLAGSGRIMRGAPQPMRGFELKHLLLQLAEMFLRGAEPVVTP